MVIRRRGNDPLLSRRRRSTRRRTVGCLYWQPCTNGPLAHRHALDVNRCDCFESEKRRFSRSQVEHDGKFIPCLRYSCLSLFLFRLETCWNGPGFWRGHPCGASNYHCANWRWVQHDFCVQSSHIFGITTLLSSQPIWWANFVAPVLYSLKPQPSTQFSRRSKRRRRRSEIELFVLANFVLTRGPQCIADNFQLPFLQDSCKRKRVPPRLVPLLLNMVNFTLPW